MELIKKIKQMKTQIIVLSLIFIYANCEDFILNRSRSVKGNGKIVEKSISLSDIRNIENTGIFNIHINQGDKEEAKVKIDENMLSYLSYSIEKNTISICSNGEFNFIPSKADVYITLKVLESVENTGVGNVDIDNFNSETNLEIENSGVGNVRINAIKAANLIVENSGTGTVDLTGTTTKLKLENSGVGSVNSFDLQTDFAEIDNSGVGSVNVFAAKEINISNDGMGSVIYKGNAVVKNLEESGFGTVKKIVN